MVMRKDPMMNELLSEKSARIARLLATMFLMFAMAGLLGAGTTRAAAGPPSGPPPPPHSGGTGPMITSLSPGSVVAGSAGFTLMVSGANFTATSVVSFGKTALTTTYVSATQLTAAVPATAIATASPKPVSVTVGNGSSTGAPSQPAPFQILPVAVAGQPTITSLAPPSAAVGGPAFTLTVNGTGYISASVVMFGQTALTTTYVSATQLTAAVPATAIAQAGPVQVTVSNGTGMPTSLPVCFNVIAPLPAAEVYFLTGSPNSVTNAGLFMSYMLPSTATVDFTQSVTLTLQSQSSPAVSVYSLGPVTLTASSEKAPGGKSITVYEYTSKTAMLTAAPEPNTPYCVTLMVKGLDLSAVDATKPVLITLTVGTQTFTVQASVQTGTPPPPSH